MHQHVVALLDAGPDDEGGVARRRRDEQAGRLVKGPAVGDGQQKVLLGAELGRVGALGGAEDTAARGEAGVGGAARRGDDGAGELGAGDPGECW